ncbi:MAG: dipeptidase [Prevotellaceae bacterium]|jgi:microsomal dipeptidase-like Zn-dependent dipeptidase|nr:dipeptidase [Prevotellaceae bacterium]
MKPLKPLLSLILIALPLASLFSQPQDLAAIADSLHCTFISIDTHNDASLKINYPGKPSSTAKGQVSFPLMKEGRLDVAFFAAFITQGPRTPKGHQKAFEDAEFQINGLKEYVQKHSQEANLVCSPQEMQIIKESGKGAMVLAIENGYCIGADLWKIEHFSKMGVQMMTICHNGNNDICDSYRDTEQFGGLSAFGREVVKEMNRLGMMIDVSHASKATTLEVAALSEYPIMASHSGVFSLYNSLRNVSDEEIIAIAAKGGLIQVGIGGFFLSALPRAEVSVKHIADHIDYVVKLVGVEFVGIGSDFDGGGGVGGCNSMGEMKNITIELLKRGYTSKQIAMIWGGNVMRMMDRVQEVKSKKY